MSLKKVRIPYLKRILGALLLLVFVFLHSCMQFRTSDIKTRAYFKEAGLTSVIKYDSLPVINFPIRVVSTGTNSRYNVIFVHGAPGSGDAYYSYLKDSVLLKHTRLYTYDRPGYGYSGFGESMPSIKEQSQVLSHLINYNNLSNVILVGHSYGGPIAAYTSILNLNVKSVVMVAPAISPKDEKYYWLGNLAKWKMTRWMVPKSWRVSADEKYSHEVALEGLEDDWKKVAVPIIHIHGTEDRIVPYGNMDYSKIHFNSVYFSPVAVPGENHFILWSNDRLIKDKILTLTKRVE